MKKQIFEKKVYQYTAIFEPDTEVGGYTVSIPALPGCISEGDTFEEALRNIEEAASLYLEVLNDRKKSAPKNDDVIIAPVYITA